MCVYEFIAELCLYYAKIDLVYGSSNNNIVNTLVYDNINLFEHMRPILNKKLNKQNLARYVMVNNNLYNNKIKNPKKGEFVR